ncbi:MAG: inosine/xanthosine triphosphatase [Candidatus Dojkabacteria bacterium]
MKKVIVASTNPVKIKSTEEGFKKVFPNEEFEFIGQSVQSGVSDQPMSNEETLKGATGRAVNAREQFPNADFWVGIEGGIQDENGKMGSFAWIVIASKDKIGEGRSGEFILPQKVADLIRGGMELGDADDKVFGGTNTKQKNGSIGILTKDVITRAGYYEPTVVMSLIPFINSELY